MKPIPTEETDDSQSINLSKKKNHLSITVYNVSLFIASLFCLFVSLWVWIYVGSLEELRSTETKYIKKELKIKDTSSMKARVMGHHHHVHYLRCTDFDYGCCKINYYNPYFNEFTSYTISPYHEVKHDKNGTNCPTFLSIINYYQLHQGVNQTSDSSTCSYKLSETQQKKIYVKGGCPGLHELVHCYETNNYESRYDSLFFLVILIVIILICYSTSKR